MIHLNLDISNPWRTRNEEDITNYICKHWKLSKNKRFELQISKWGYAKSLLEADIDLRWRGHSHAGPEINIEIWRYFFCVKLYDRRHWNYEIGDWHEHEDEDEQVG